MTTLTIHNTMQDMTKVPELQPVARYLLYSPADSRDEFSDMPIESVRGIGWSPEGMVKGLNFVTEQFAHGAKVYFVYDAQDCADDAQKAHVNFIRLTPETIDPKKPYIVLAAGGGYMSVCSAVEAYPTAAEIVKRGYQVFVMVYRVGETGIMPKPLDDVAAVLAYIRAHAGQFQVDADNYAIGGYSAGGNLVSSWGTANVGYKAYGLPKPKAMFPVYPVTDLKSLDVNEEMRGFLKVMLGEDFTAEKVEKYNVVQQVDADYPPCYIVCGKDDATVPCANSEELKARLDACGIPAILEEGEHAAHGFGDGTGTDVEGWPHRAIDFLESL